MSVCDALCKWGDQLDKFDDLLDKWGAQLYKVDDLLDKWGDQFDRRWEQEGLWGV